MSAESGNPTYTGGCLCGAVRYEGGELWGAAYCHCRICQKSVGNAFSAFAQFPRDSFRLTHGEPRWYRSSELGERGFCAECGTPLFVRYLTAEFSDWIVALIGSLDHPETVAPRRHFGAESMLPWLEIVDDLPRDSYPENFIEECVAHDRVNLDRRPSGFQIGANRGRARIR